MTVETDGISSRWILDYDGDPYEHEVSRSDLHLEEKDGSLKIYVPRGEEGRETCFFDALPRRLLSWMMTPAGRPEVFTSPLDEAVVGVILVCSVSAVPTMLERKGVPEITEVQEVPLLIPDEPSESATSLSIPDVDPSVVEEFAAPLRNSRQSPTPRPRLHVTEGSDTSASTSRVARSVATLLPVPVVPHVDRDVSTPLRPQSQASLSSQSPDLTPPSAVSSPGDLSPASGDTNYYATPLASPRVNGFSSDDEAPIFQLPAARSATTQEKYQELLGTVISLARRMARQDHDSLGMESAFSGLSLEGDDVFSCPSARADLASSSDRKIKIGAAGELFVRQNLLAFTTHYTVIKEN